MTPNGDTEGASRHSLGGEHVGKWEYVKEIRGHGTMAEYGGEL